VTLIIPGSTNLKQQSAEEETLVPDTLATRGRPPVADRLLSYAILGAGLLTFFVGAYQILSSHSPVPKWDEWHEIHAIASAPDHHPPLSWLWSQHNEHRLPFYRLLLLADVHFFHGNHWIMFLGILMVQSAFLMLLAWLLWWGGLRADMWRNGVGLAAFCLFCPTQWENFTWGLQILFFLSPFLFTVALAALLKYSCTPQESSHQWTYLALSILACGAATYSIGNGVAVWPIVIFIALALRLRARVIAMYALAACLFVGSYLYHYVSPNPDLSPLVSIRQPLSLFRFIAAYLGVALPPWISFRNTVAIATGCLGLLAATGVMVWLIRRRQWQKPLPLLLLGVMLFCIGTAFITALARVGLGLDAAFASRYQTFNLLFWFSVATSWLLIFRELRPPWRTSLLASIAVTMVLAATQFPLPLRAGLLITHRSEAAATALLTGIPDRKALSLLNTDPDMIWRDEEYLRQQHLFMFSDWWRGQLDELVTDAYRIGPSEACQGQISLLEPVSREDLLAGDESAGLRIAGWAVDRASGDAVRKLIIVADGRISGFAIGGLQLETKGSKSFLKKSRFVEWSGSVRPPAGAGAVEVYAILSGNLLCRLARLPVQSH
jgi:hypothetical protein